MDKPSYRAAYQRGQLYFTMSFGADDLILVRRWAAGTDTWTLLVGEDLEAHYSYPKADVREWVEGRTDPLTAEVSLAAFEDRMNAAIARVDGLREEHVPPHRIEEELFSASALFSPALLA